MAVAQVLKVADKGFYYTLFDFPFILFFGTGNAAVLALLNRCLLLVFEIFCSFLAFRLAFQGYGTLDNL
jgi:hypothetical protein